METRAHFQVEERFNLGNWEHRIVTIGVSQIPADASEDQLEYWIEVAAIGAAKAQARIAELRAGTQIQRAEPPKVNRAALFGETTSAPASMGESGGLPQPAEETAANASPSASSLEVCNPEPQRAEATAAIESPSNPASLAGPSDLEPQQVEETAAEEEQPQQTPPVITEDELPAAHTVSGGAFMERREPKKVPDDFDPFAELASEKRSTVIRVTPATMPNALGFPQPIRCPACGTTLAESFDADYRCQCGQLHPDSPLAKAEKGDADAKAEQAAPVRAEQTKVEPKQAAPSKAEAPKAEPKPNPHTDAATIMSHRVGDDDSKCLRCGADTLKALVQGKVVRICSKDDCFVSDETARTYALLYGDPTASGSSKEGPPAAEPRAAEDTAAFPLLKGNLAGESQDDPAQVPEAEQADPQPAAETEQADPQPAAETEQADPQADSQTAPEAEQAEEPPAIEPEAAVTTIPAEEEVETHVEALGVRIEMPPIAWTMEPITQTTKCQACFGTGFLEGLEHRGKCPQCGGDPEQPGGQMKAINAGLTSLGYGGDKRHVACLSILGEAYGSLARPKLATLKDLTKAEAHVILSWIERAGPQQLALMKAEVERREGQGVLVA